MERFEMNDIRGLDFFKGFVNKAKETFTSLVEDIRASINSYEVAIEDTQREIADSEASKEKCEQEIIKMEQKIDSIKEAIENVEKTYKGIVDAYSSTSKGETKEIYSDIIDGAKTNCEKDVEKNRTEIARINSDIEAIRNNIAEFTKTINELNRNLDSYYEELKKYQDALTYFERLSTDVERDLDDISSDRASRIKPAYKKRVEYNPIVEKETMEEPEASVLEDTPKNDNEPVIEETKGESQDIEESLQRIYDLTGYKPKKEEEVNSSKPVFSDNLENLFVNSGLEDIKPEITESKYEEDLMSEWEKILNGADFNSTLVKDEPKPQDNAEETVDQLLKPYGTTFKRLKALVNDKIIYKDGTSLPVNITVEDVVKAVNTIDGNDLKAMKTVGPEITLLRKIKKEKEGSR